MSEYVFCIPSYQRADRQKTLDLLESIGVPKKQIYLSVQTDLDLKKYESAGVARRVNELLMRGAAVRPIIGIRCLTIFRAGRRSYC